MDVHAHLREYLKLLNEIDGKVVHVTFVPKHNDANFDRAVRESIDRQHRRRVIAEG